MEQLQLRLSALAKMGHDMAAVEDVLAEQNAVLAGYKDLPPVSSYHMDCSIVF